MIAESISCLKSLQSDRIPLRLSHSPVIRRLTDLTRHISNDCQAGWRRKPRSTAFSLACQMLALFNFR